METKDIKLTEQEATGLISLIDIAIKAGGVNNAEMGMYFVNKVRDAFKREELEQAQEQ